MRFKKKWKKVLQPDKGKYGIYKKAGIVLLLSIVMFSAVYVTDNHRQLAQDENGNRILERKGQGEGKKTENIQMETGEWKEKIKVQISEKNRNSGGSSEIVSRQWQGHLRQDIL